MVKLNQTLEPSEFAKFIDQADIRTYASDLFYNWVQHRSKIDDQLDEAMDKWNIRRLGPRGSRHFALGDD